MNKVVEQFCGQCAVATVAKDKVFLIFLMGEKKKEKISIVMHN